MDEKLSILGQRWTDFSHKERDILTISQNYEVSHLLAKLILNRGLSGEDVSTYLNPTIKTLLKNPSLLVDMDKSVDRVIDAVQKNEKIVIFADYDVDGATSSAIIRRYFDEINYPTDLYIPDRIDEGYGPNKQAMSFIKESGANVIIMCDCGTTSFEALTFAQDLGLDVIVIDHHTTEAELPPHFSLINPYRLDQSKEGKDAFLKLCTAGLAFVFLVSLNRKRREKNEHFLPDLLNYLDLVALGTVCDVMPLQNLNRAFVSQGLKVLGKRKNVGLSSLMDVASVFQKPSTYHLGFVLGPRINAGGRVAEASLGSNLLTTNDKILANTISQKLNHFNLERQTLEKIVLEQAFIKIEKEELYKKSLILVGSKDWHPGVIGIVASRIKDKYNKPTIVVSFEEDEGKGSGRSIPGVELGSAMHEAVHKKLLKKGGGHSMAVGLTIDRSSWIDFENFLCNKFKSVVEEYIPTVKIDHTLSVDAISIDLAKEISKLEPFGQGNPTPKFKIENVFPKMVIPVGDGHFKIIFENKTGKTLEAMAFRIRGTKLEDVLVTQKGWMNIVGTIRIDTWNHQEKVAFFLDDVWVPY